MARKYTQRSKEEKTAIVKYVMAHLLPSSILQRIERCVCASKGDKGKIRTVNAGSIARNNIFDFSGLPPLEMLGRFQS